MILISVRDIKKDEEVCISYVGLENLSETKTPRMIRLNLRLKWGIVCNPNCLCSNRAYWEKIQIGRELEKTIKRIGESGRNEEAVAAAIAMRLVQLERVGGLQELSVIGVRRTSELGFQILTKEVNSATSLLEFLANELLEPMQEADNRNQAEETGRVNRNRAGQPFCAYKVRVIPE